MNKRDIRGRLTLAIRDGKLETARELINSYGLPYSESSPKGYGLLCDALAFKHSEVAKLLLTSGSEVNSYHNPSNTPLHFAVKNGDIEIIKMLLVRGANINAQNSFDETPLYNAVKNNRLEIIELLLKHEADVNVKNGCGQTPLYDAIKNNRLEITELLVKHKADVNAKDHDVKSPLQVAMQEGNLQIVEVLLKNGADINCVYTSRSVNDYTPLHFAVEKGSLEVMTLLLSRGANVDVKAEDSVTPLHIAARKGCLCIAENLLNHGACIHSLTLKGCTPLHFAVEKGSLEVMTLLLSRGANVDVKAEDGVTPLHIAAKKGYLCFAENLLNHGACIHSVTLKEGYTPLHFASKLGNEECVELFLNRGADIEASAKGNLTPLYVAVAQGHKTVVRLLLRHGAKVDHQDTDGKTILHLAVEGRHLMIVEDVLKYCPDINNQSNRRSLNTAVCSYGTEKIVEALLEYGLIVHPENANNFDLFQTAIEKGYLKIVSDLLKYGANVNTLHNLVFFKGYIYNLRKHCSFSTHLHKAVKYKQQEVAKLLLSYKADINAQDVDRKTPLFYAIENEDLKITKLLLDNGANVKDDPELLNIAVKRGCTEIVELLLQHNADVNATDKYGNTALFLNVCGWYQDSYKYLTDRDSYVNNIKGKITKLLLDHGANVDAQTPDGETPLQLAIYNGYSQVVEVLLEYNANVNVRDKDSLATPLHKSARRKNVEICKMLLNKGLDVDAVDCDGFTALHIATLEGSNDIVKLLLERGAKVDSKTKCNITPLYLSAQRGQQEIIETLLKFGADINSRYKYGRTALHIASHVGHVKVVTTLLEYGCDINSRDKDGKTALHIASHLGHNEVVTTLLEYGSDINIMTRKYLTPLDYAKTVETIEILKRHIVQIKTANLYVSQRNLLSVDEISYPDFQEKCVNEITSMKSEKMNNYNISFYDILIKNTHSLAICLRNENIVQILKLNDYKTKFPIYGSIIKSRFRNGMKRKELLDQGNKILHFLFVNHLQLPQECTEKICSYLSDEDLKIIIEKSILSSKVGLKSKKKL